MKKTLILFAFLITIITQPFFAQATYFFNDTTGTVAKRITALESSNYLSPSSGYIQYVTITGYASGDIDFSFGDSLFASKTSVSFGSGSVVAVSVAASVSVAGGAAAVGVGVSGSPGV